MRFSIRKPAPAVACLAVAMILAGSQSLRAGEENEFAYSSFGSGVTLGEAMASGGTVSRVGQGSGVTADGSIEVPTSNADGTAGNAVAARPAGIAVPSNSLAEFFTDALWRKKTVRTLYRQSQAD